MKYRIKRHETRNAVGELDGTKVYFTIERSKDKWYSRRWLPWTSFGFSTEDLGVYTIPFKTEELARTCLDNIKAERCPKEKKVTVIYEESDEAQEGCKSGKAS